jgi:repressor LexA
MTAATEKQITVLEYIRGFIKQHSYPPTVREIANHFSITAKGAYDHLTALKKKGRINFEYRKPRTITIKEIP